MKAPNAKQRLEAKNSLIAFLALVWKVDLAILEVTVELWDKAWWGWPRVQEISVASKTGGSSIMRPAWNSSAWILNAEQYLIAYVEKHFPECAGSVLPASYAQKTHDDDFEAVCDRIRWQEDEDKFVEELKQKAASNK